MKASVTATGSRGHDLPHFHARFSDELRVELATLDVMTGRLSTAKQRLLLRWATVHQAERMRNRERPLVRALVHPRSVESSTRVSGESVSEMRSEGPPAAVGRRPMVRWPRSFEMEARSSLTLRSKSFRGRSPASCISAARLVTVVCAQRRSHSVA